MAPAVPQEMDNGADAARGVAVPVIDLQGSHGERRGEVVQQIRKACIEWGGFQLINHGVPSALMERMHRVAAEFFALPVEEKSKFHTKSAPALDFFYGYGTQQLGSKGALTWGDQLRHKTWPLSTRAYEQWPTNPASFIETEEEYLAEQAKLSKHLYELISESLGLRSSYLNDLSGEDYVQIFLVNHYFPSPESNPMDGLQKHSDICGITILMQDTAGLQFNAGGEWVTVEPIPDALVVNLGDFTEIWTNGLYKSPEHKALLNSKERLSILTFAAPPADVTIAPIPELLSESNPSRYKARIGTAYTKEILAIPYMAKTLTTDL